MYTIYVHTMYVYAVYMPNGNPNGNLTKIFQPSWGYSTRNLEPGSRVAHSNVR